MSVEKLAVLNPDLPRQFIEDALVALQEIKDGQTVKISKLSNGKPTVKIDIK